MFLKLLIFLIIFYLSFTHSSTVFASQSAFLSQSELTALGFTSYEKINPNLLIYPLKRVIEELKLNLLQSEETKIEYFYQLLDIRFRELVYIINNKKEGFIFFTADRYNTFIGKLKKDYPIDALEKTKISSYLKMLEILRDRYQSNSLYWEKIQQTVDTTRSLL